MRKIESEEGCLIFDDTIQEKEWTDENEVMCWHFDHCKGRSVKGINLLNALYHSKEVSIPVAFEVVRKPVQFSDVATRKVKRACVVTKKNEHLREMVAACVSNQLKFRYVLMDSWFAAQENFEFIVEKKKHFIAALKDNRLVALSEEDKKQGRFVRVSLLALTDRHAVRGWLKGFGNEVLLVRRVFPPPRAKPARWGINKQRRQHGRIESGVQRFGMRRRIRHHDLPETVESGRVSQIVEIECGTGEVPDSDGEDAE